MIHTTPARLRRVLRHLSSCHKSSCAVSAPASEWSKSLWSLSCQSFSSNSNRLPLSPVLFFSPLSPSRPVPFFLFPTILGVVPSSTFQQQSGVLATLPWQHSHGSPTYFFPPLPLLLPPSSCHANFLFPSVPYSPRNS